MWTRPPAGVPTWYDAQKALYVEKLSKEFSEWPKWVHDGVRESYVVQDPFDYVRSK